MFYVEINGIPFIERAKQMNAAIDQLPFVWAGLLNDGAFAARRVLIESTWPKHVVVRNKAFLSASLRVDKATKNHLEVRIYDVLGRGHLWEHAQGGTVTARGHRMTLPNVQVIQRTSRGVRQRDKARTIIDETPKRALRILPQGIFVGEGKRLHLKYSFKQSVTIRKDVPFYDDFQFVMGATLRTGFQARMALAMATRR